MMKITQLQEATTDELLKELEERYQGIFVAIRFKTGQANQCGSGIKLHSGGAAILSGFDPARNFFHTRQVLQLLNECPCCGGGKVEPEGLNDG